VAAVGNRGILVDGDWSQNALHNHRYPMISEANALRWPAAQGFGPATSDVISPNATHYRNDVLFPFQHFSLYTTSKGNRSK
jgi:hypothetical protein